MLGSRRPNICFPSAPSLPGLLVQQSLFRCQASPMVTPHGRHTRSPCSLSRACKHWFQPWVCSGNTPTLLSFQYTTHQTFDFIQQTHIQMHSATAPWNPSAMTSESTPHDSKQHQHHIITWAHRQCGQATGALSTGVLLLTLFRILSSHIGAWDRTALLLTSHLANLENLQCHRHIQVCCLGPLHCSKTWENGEHWHRIQLLISKIRRQQLNGGPQWISLQPAWPQHTCPLPW